MPETRGTSRVTAGSPTEAGPEHRRTRDGHLEAVKATLLGDKGSPASLVEKDWTRSLAKLSDKLVWSVAGRGTTDSSTT